MATYGGKSSYGGLSRYGGGDQVWLIYYRVLKSIALPGFWPNDDELEINRLLRTDAKGLSQAKIHAERLLSEFFPSSADECLPEWAKLLGVVFAAAATLAEKQGAVQGKFLGSLGSSLPAIRKILFPILNPTTAFFDDFDKTEISPRYELDGNGTRVEATSVLTIALAGAVVGTWDGTTLTPTANRTFLRVPDIDDDFTADFELASFSLLADTALGFFVQASAQNVTQFVLGNTGGADEIRIDQIIDGTLTEDVDSKAAAAPGVPQFYRIRKLAGELIFSNGATIAALSEFHRVDVRHKTRHVGFFVRNAAGVNAVSMGADSFKVVMDTPENNVEIIELDEEIVDLSGKADDIFTFFVHRDPTDPGSFDLKVAQRTLDVVAQGHAVGVAGESDVFLTDDDSSLTDRDVLGS